nr:MAG TPA: hypothetical protein [Bacteriophage sp.]
MPIGHQLHTASFRDINCVHFMLYSSFLVGDCTIVLMVWSPIF